MVCHRDKIELEIDCELLEKAKFAANYYGLAVEEYIAQLIHTAPTGHS